MYHSVALLLPDGKVMCAGGANPNDGEPYPDLGVAPPWPPHWGEDPAQPVGPLSRTYSARTLVPGSPLGYAGPALNDKTFEFYEPPYCFNGARPTITGITRNGTSVRRIEYGQEFKVQTPQAASIDRVALMRPNAPTHHTDTEQRYVQLSFTKQVNELTVTAVNDKKVAPPGYYMLWIVATGLPHGLPCEKAEFIQLVPSGTSCVVATATLGSPDHPSVEYLRELRRQISETTATGNGFIRIVNRVYESFSPRLANYLQQAPLARSAVRNVVVRPTVGIVKATQQITSPLPPTLREAALISLLAVEGLLGAAATPLLFTLVVARIIAGKLLGERYA
jgi:hypothetical protein